MPRTAEKSIQIEWFNVTYKSVITSIALVVTVILGAGGYWYYFWIYAPKAGASGAIVRAERRFSEAATVQEDPRVAEVLASAKTALGDAREAFAEVRYDAAKVSAIRSENYSLQALRTIRGKEDAQFVRFYRIEGDVRVKRSGEFAWERATEQMVLGIGDQVKSSSSASAQLIYFDQTLTTIQPGSLLEIRELYEDPVTKVRRVREKLNWGELNASTQKRNVDGSFHEVATDNVSARADDEGEFRVKFDREKKTAKYDVFQGRIEVRSGSKRENVVAGESIRSTSAGKLSAKQELPPAPRLFAPRDQRVFITEGQELGSLTLTWEQVAAAENYHLVISNQPLFTTPLFDGVRIQTTAELGDIAPHSYYWKVASISKSGVEGHFSPPRRFRVSSRKIVDRSDTEPPVLEITEFVPIGTMVIVNGRTEPGVSLWVDNDKIDVDDSGSFYTVIRLRKEGMNRLRFVAQDTAGNETELLRSAHLEIY